MGASSMLTHWETFKIQNWAELWDHQEALLWSDP